MHLLIFKGVMILQVLLNLKNKYCQSHIDIDMVKIENDMFYLGIEYMGEEFSMDKIPLQEIESIEIYNSLMDKNIKQSLQKKMADKQGRIFGTVKWWKEEKGYGFIQGDDNESYFIHYKNIKEKGIKNLYRGQRVNFIPEETDKGLTAIKLHYEKAMNYLED